MLANTYRTFKNTVKSIRCRLRRQFYTGRLKPRNITVHSAVVVAPHPDDEIFGTGGMIAMKREKGVPVHVIFLTAGEISHSICCSGSSEKVGKVRRKQAMEATSYLGLQSDHLTWLNLTDGKIPFGGQAGFNETVTNLSIEIDRLVPTEIYCPHPHDWFPDHEAAFRIVKKAAQLSNHNVKIIYYTVWAWYNTPSPMSKFFNWKTGWKLNIHSVLEKKAAAANHYLNSTPAPCGYPYCGRLPKALLHGIRKPNEIFFDGNIKHE